MNKIKKNLPYSLKIYEGIDLSGDNSVAGDETEVILIGSEIKPVEIARIEDPEDGNGSSESNRFHIIVQSGVPYLVIEKQVSYSYGYKVQKTECKYEVKELENIKKEMLTINYPDES